MLAISTYATKSYFYIWPQFLRRISAAAAHHKDVYFILASDKSDKALEAIEIAKEELPEGWHIVFLNLNVEEEEQEEEKYKVKSQILIAKLQNAAFSFARKIRADFLWSVESDILVSEESLKISEWVLQMPDLNGVNFYDVAACTYPNSLFLGGFGAPNKQIEEDFSYEERAIPKRFEIVFKKRQENFEKLKKQELDILKSDKVNKTELQKVQEKLEKELKKLEKLASKVKNFPPDGNIWEVIAKYGWRRRGWFDFAYPGIGRGSIVPSDWCGLGCTLLSKKALLLSEFSGYQGKGTQDLFLCWEKWYPKNIRIACIPHCPCDHVKIDKEQNKILHYKSYYETEGEFKNHLRTSVEEWIPT